MLLQFARERVRPLNAFHEDDEGFHDLAACFIRARDNGGFGDGGVLDQRAFDLERADPVSSGDDDVVAAPDKPEIAVFIAIGAIASEIPLVAPRRVCALGVVLVAEKQPLRRRVE